MVSNSTLTQPNIKVTCPAPREVWHCLFKADPEALPYQSPAWLDCICAGSYYEDASRLYESQDGRQLLMPLVRRKGWPQLLTTQASLPYGWGIGGLLTSGRIEKNDLDAVFDDLTRLPYLRTSIRPNPRQGEIWAMTKKTNVVVIPRLAHVLDLEGGFDKVWAERFERKTRNRIRKAERSGVTVEKDSTGRLIPVFYDLLLQSLDRWASQQHEPRWLAHWRGRQRDPLRKFQNIARILGDACTVWVAWVNGQAAAADLVLQYGNVNDSRSAMNKELAGPTEANDLLMKLMIEDACRAGCRYYHMGETGMSATLAHFKSRFGAVAYPYAEYHIERFPITGMESRLRRFVKHFIGFKDA